MSKKCRLETSPPAVLQFSTKTDPLVCCFRFFAIPDLHSFEPLTFLSISTLFIAVYLKRTSMRAQGLIFIFPFLTFHCFPFSSFLLIKRTFKDHLWEEVAAIDWSLDYAYIREKNGWFVGNFWRLEVMVYSCNSCCNVFWIFIFIRFWVTFERFKIFEIV